METSHLNKPGYRPNHEEVKKKRYQNPTVWARGVRKYRDSFYSAF